MSFLQPLMLAALPLIALPIIIHLINQWRYQSRPWGAMMFLLAANRMNRGFARIRQWLILAMRTLAIAGLIFAVARPLSSGLFGLTGGGKIDTAIVILDTSPSMQQVGQGGLSKLDTAKQQLKDALGKLGAARCVLVAADGTAVEFESTSALFDSPLVNPSSATSQLPKQFEGAVDYLRNNEPGPTEIWICSDLRQNDWETDSSLWPLSRDGLAELPLSVNVNLVAYPEPDESNLAVRVTSARRASYEEDAQIANELLLSFQISRPAADESRPPQDLAVEINLGGNTSSLPVEMTGNRIDVRNHRLPLPASTTSGWGYVSIAADGNAADNKSYFVFAEPALRRVVVVSDEPTSTQPLEIAASITDDGTENPAIEILPAEQVDTLALTDTALLIWQGPLPDRTVAPAVEKYITDGGQVLFFPPADLRQSGLLDQGTFMGVAWDRWVEASGGAVELPGSDEANPAFRVNNWRGDQDLLAATNSGVGLPVGSLEIRGYATLDGDAELSTLAELQDGQPLLAKLPTDAGGVYFCTTTVGRDVSSLAESGVVLFVALQRAIVQGQEALGKVTQRDALETGLESDWDMVAGSPEVLSTAYDSTAGIYDKGELTFAVNRRAEEDSAEVVDDDTLAGLFAGLQYSRVDATAGDLGGLVREVWRVFLILMIIALIVEAALSLPRKPRTASAGLGESFGRESSQMGRSGGFADRASKEVPAA